MNLPIRSQARTGPNVELTGAVAGGHRLYDVGDVARLCRIIRLRQLGFPLSQAPK